MPRFKVLTKCHVLGRVLEEGEIVDLDIEAKSGQCPELIPREVPKGKGKKSEDVEE